MTIHHASNCDGQHDPAELYCRERIAIMAGNQHNPWKCYSPANNAGFHQFSHQNWNARCDFRGCPRLRSEMAAYWGVR